MWAQCRPCVCGEGYRKTDLNVRDLAEIVAYPGFFHLARRHWRMGMGEMWRSWNKAAFVRALQRLMPEITAEHLDPAPAGVRAQAITPDGKLLDDFAFSETDGSSTWSTRPRRPRPVVEHWRVHCGEGGGAVLGQRVEQRSEVGGQRSEGGDRRVAVWRSGRRRI